jgi:hypothetical protein
MEFFNRSKFSLTNLQPYWIDVPEPAFHILLTTVGRHLTDLHVQGPPACISDDLLTHLRINPRSPNICPKLDAIGFFGLFDYSDGALAVMARSRLLIKDNVRFREAGLVRPKIVRVSDELGIAELDELRGMREHGLVFDVYDIRSGC